MRLPRTFRPLGVRMAAYVFGALLLVIVVVMWFAFPQEVRDQFTWFQRGTVVFIGLVIGIGGHALARCCVVAGDKTMTVVNGYRSHTYEWSEVLGISLRTGSPWATFDLSDGTTVSAMGIQGSDGARAVTHVKQLRAIVAQQSRTDRND